MRRIRWRTAIVLLVAAGLRAEDGDPSPVPPVVEAEHLRGLVREFVGEAMAEAGIPGAAVAVVHDGEVVLLEGFGDADVEAGVGVDPNRTVFRLGSISKPLTATTILALLEGHELDLDRDVRPLLDDLDLRPDYPQPLTLRQLLTHTAGFNENLFGQHARRRQDWLPLDRYLAARLTPRFAPPGEVIAYTDFHTSLAGLVAARVAGKPFEQQVEERLFGPLEMRASTFRQTDLPEAVAGGLAKSYGLRGGELAPYARDFVHTTPAAGLQSTAADMARYLIALLDDGVVAGRERVMTPRSWRIQKTIQHRHHELLDGKALGLTQVRHGGRSLLYKNGQASGFSARILLAPDDRLAVFSVHNRSILGPFGTLNAASRFHTALGWRLFDALLPELDGHPPPEPSPARGSSDRLVAYEGVYRTTVASRHTAEKIVSMMSDLRVERLDGDRLRIGGSPYVEIEPALFQYEGARFYVRFASPRGDRSPYLFVGAGAYERIPWYESSAVTVRLAIGFVALFATASIVLAWRWRRLGRRHAPGPLPAARRLALAALSVAALNLLFLAVFGTTTALADVQHLFHGWPWTVKASLALPLAAALGLMATVRGLASRTARRQAGPVVGVAAALVLAAGVLFLWWLGVWNLLGWRL